MPGLGTLISLILRRDRLKLPIWVLGFVSILLLMVPLLRDVYGDAQSIDVLFTTFGVNPAGLFMTGPMDKPTFGALMSIETVIWFGMAIAFMNTLLVVRHTRYNEEMGAQDLLLSGTVHRSTSLVAVLLIALIVNGLVVVGLGFGIQLFQADWSGADLWLYAVSMGMFGFVWASIAALVAQLTDSSRVANGLLAGLIGLGFLLRGIGDFFGKINENGIHQPEWMSYLSPFGWLQLTRSLTFSDWSPVLFMIAFSLAVIGMAYWIQNRRDVGSGVLPGRKGKSKASKLLKTPMGMTLKLQKSVFIGWLVGVLVMVMTIGVLVPQMTDVYSQSESMKQMIVSIGGEGSLIPSFMSAMLAITSLMVFAYAVQAVSKLRSEESAGHLESLLATKLSRLKWIVWHLTVVVCGSFLLLLVAGLVLAITTNLSSDLTVSLLEYCLAGLSYLPVALFFMAIYVLIFGLLPRLSGTITWIYFGFVAFMLWLGPILQVDQRVMDLSIMEHFASVPLEAANLQVILIVSLLSILLMIVGVFSWTRRDLTN